MRYIIQFVLLIVSPLVMGQAHWCLTDSLYQAELKNNPEKRREVEQFEEAWQKSQVEKALQKSMFRSFGGFTTFAYQPPYIYNVDKTKIQTIPMVFHVIHPAGFTEEIQHRTDEQIKKLVKYVNEVYAGISPRMHTIREGGVFTPIQFALAQRDENNNPSTGIIHVDGSGIGGYAENGLGKNGANEGQLKGLSYWNPNYCLNIYVVNKIGSGALAYAYVGGHGTVFMKASYAREGSDTLPHELGHSLNLHHTFEGGGEYRCPPDNNCLTDNDKICDTEAIKTLYWRRPTSNEINECTGKPYDGGQYNIMNYLNGASKRFTEGQVDRMVFELQHNGTKRNLLNSKAYFPPVERQEVAESCTPPGTKRPNNQANVGPANVIFGDLSYRSQGYNFDDNQYYLNHTKSNPVKFIAGKTYPFDISVGLNPHRVWVFIDYNNNGVFEDVEQVFVANIGSEKYFSQLKPEFKNYKITIPLNAVKNIPLRMRVVGDLQWTKPANPKCAQHEYGQTEDFAIIIIDPAPEEETLTKVGVNTTTPETTLEVKSTGNGVIFPKMNNQEMWNVKSPATGMLIYNTSEHCLAMNYGTEDQPLWRCLETRDMN
ncbi:hypothetical protein KRX57_07410 [Weeksellaceae bacterium TAE3-ERU29]|nr:hypothetical protein [Weeksellaceae bacterium TAE3-ERU29]